MSKQRPTISGIDKRGESVSILGFGVSLLGALTLAWLAIWGHSSSPAVWGVALQMFGAAGIWVLCWLNQHQRRLIAEERLELDELERQRRDKLGGVQTIFEDDELEQMDALASGRRLRSIERIITPVGALLIAAYHVWAGIALMPFLWSFPPLAASPGLPEFLQDANNQDFLKFVLFFAGGISFATFMMARYALGLRRVAGFGGLRAGGSYLFGSSLLSFGLAISMIFVIVGFVSVDYWYAILVGAVMLMLAVETVTIFVLEIYRPRAGEEDARAFYDSRLLGFFSEPGGVAESVGKFADYQFGFKVSESWLYKLLSWQVPVLILLQVVILFILTMVVVVPPGHQAILLNFGNPAPVTAKPGLHFKMPWPVETAEIIPVQRVQFMELGHAPEGPDESESNFLDRVKRLFLERRAAREDDGARTNQVRKEAVLWTKPHFAEEYKLLVGERPSKRTEAVGRSDDQLPVNLLSVTMPVYWRVRSDDEAVIRYYREARDAAAIIESLAYQELTRYAASADLSDLLSDGGTRASVVIHERLQKACDTVGDDRGGLGVEIVYLSVGGIHPPPEEKVAEAYEQVVSAMEKREADVKRATAEASERRIKTAGSQWAQLRDLMQTEEAARAGGDDDLQDRTAAVERFLRETAGGEARSVVSEAVRASYAALMSEKAKAERYQQQVAAYETAPHTYLLRTYLASLTQALSPVRKYIIAIDDPSRVIIDSDLSPPGEFDVLKSEIARADKMNERPE